MDYTTKEIFNTGFFSTGSFSDSALPKLRELGEQFPYSAHVWFALAKTETDESRKRLALERAMFLAPNPLALKHFIEGKKNTDKVLNHSNYVEVINKTETPAEQPTTDESAVDFMPNDTQSIAIEVKHLPNSSEKLVYPNSEGHRTNIRVETPEPNKPLTPKGDNFFDGIFNLSKSLEPVAGIASMANIATKTETELEATLDNLRANRIRFLEALKEHSEEIPEIAIYPTPQKQTPQQAKAIDLPMNRPKTDLIATETLAALFTNGDNNNGADFIESLIDYRNNRNFFAMATLGTGNKDLAWQHRILDEFIEKEKDFVPNVEALKEAAANPNIIDLTDNQFEDDDDMATESMAKILVKQKKFEEAKNIYQKLIVKYPEKSDYFASLINQL